MSGHGPTVSVGIPVYNEEDSIGATIESVLEQQGPEFEIVISDNASTDATAEICRDYAARDSRVRFHGLDRNAGLLANFNRVFLLSRGRYFRWLGASDRLRPGYMEQAVAALDAAPDCVLVTTRYEYVTDDGAHLDAGWVPGPSGSEPLLRLQEILRILGTGYRNIDPMYSMMRRSALERTGLVRPIRLSDQLLAVELSLLGPYGHIGRPLAVRQHPRFLSPTEAARIFDIPVPGSRLGLLVLCREMNRLISESDLPPASRRAAQRAVSAHYVRRHLSIAGRRTRRVKSLITSSRRPSPSILP